MVAGHATGTLAETLKARDHVKQAERAFITGSSLVDMRIEAAKRRSHDAFATVRG